MKSRIESFFQNQNGATAIEYSLIAAGLAIALISGINLLGADISSAFSDVGSTLPTTVPQLK